MSSVTNAIGQSTGLASGKVGSLLSMAAPLVLGVLGQHVRQNGLSAGDLGNTLKTEAPSFERFLPAGLGSLLGGASSAVAATSTKIAAAPEKVVAAGNRWLWPLVLLAVLVIAALWYFNRAKTPEATEAPTPVTAPAAALPAGFFALKLPNGVELNVPQTGIENKLATFIADSSKPVDKTTWFDFDRLTFDTGRDTLQPSSQEQLNNVVAILKAYPNVHARIGGYTDNTGNAAANLKLSDDRAKNVMAALVAGGIDQTRLDAKGYGEEHPVASNGTEEGRAQNRRISLLVTAK